jgi:RNA polymerase sigma factor (sigma-70 family)
MRGPRPDDELVRCCRSDPEALEALYRRHVRRLTLYAASRCSRPEDVADLVAATFVAALESAHRFDPARGEALPWLVGIARHLAADASRGAQQERDALARVGSRRSLDPDEILELEERIDATRQHAELEAALKQLSIGDREALWLVGPLGLSGVQAAQALTMSPAAFRMRLMRARRLLRKALKRSSQQPRRDFPEEAPL